MNSPNARQIQQQGTARNILLELDSDDTEGSDISYESSFDEQLEQEYDQTLQQKAIVQFKDQMQRMFQLNPEIGFEVNDEDRNEGYEKSEGKLKSDDYQQRLNLKMINRNDLVNIIMEDPEHIEKEIQEQEKKNTLQEFQEKLNAFRQNNNKTDIVDLIIEEQDKLLKDIKEQEKRNKAVENAVHESIEAKVRKETGDVGYVSFRKKIQFQFRIRKAEQLAQEKQEKQLRKKETDMLKSRRIFEQLFTNEEQFKSEAAEDLYKRIQKCKDDIEIKYMILQYIIQHRKKKIEEYQNKTSLLKPTRFISEDNQEFTLLQPNMVFKEQIKNLQLSKEDLQRRENLEDDNIYILTKINQILEGNLMKTWKMSQGLNV